ncbi:MAG: aspartate aminotransferase family protein [Candidatus Bathyarchaeota archaeon]|nr:aspartate aminotransferase family protein [Candidatus Bathyarchaeota archaeon]
MRPAELWKLKQPKVGEVPGPRQSEINARTGMSSIPVIKNAGGLWIEDHDGNIFMDAVSGRCAVNIGHCHPRIMKLLGSMTVTHGVHESRVALSERLKEITPGNWEKTTSLALSGSGACDAALKYSRWATGRPRVIAFAGAYHGTTYGAMAVSSYKNSMIEGFGPHIPGVSHFPYPNRFRSPFTGEQDGDISEKVISLMKYAFDTYLPPEEVGAMFFEPVAGDAGWIFPDRGFVQALADLCHKHGIYFVSEEVQTGYGRTGEMWGIENYDVTPEVIVLGKAMGGGLPMSGIVGKLEDDLVNRRFPHGHTFSGNPVSCKASVENISIIEDENLVSNSKTIGRKVLDGLEKIRDDSAIICRAEGMGMLLTLEVGSRNNPRPDYATKIVEECYKRGVYTLNMGAWGTGCIRIAPPLVMTAEQASVLVDTLAESISEVEKNEHLHTSNS